MSDFNPTLYYQIEICRDAMKESMAMSYFLMPYYKKLLDIASRGDKEPHERPFVEEL